MVRRTRWSRCRLHVVSAASVAAYDCQVGYAAYSASKGGVVGMTLPTVLNLFETTLLATLPLEARDALGRQVPHPGRLGVPADFARRFAHSAENSMGLDAPFAWRTVKESVESVIGEGFCSP